MLDKLTVEREFKTEGDFCFRPRGADRGLIYFWPETTGGEKKKTKKQQTNTKPQAKYPKQQFQERHGHQEMKDSDP